jgi:Calcineurin-like phosphoesterase
VTGAFVFGDVHGHIETLSARLQEAGLIDVEGRWSGGGATLWLTGDLVDRGPSGAETVDFVMGLQHDAQNAGGCVQSLLGNHDLLLLGVVRFGDLETKSARRSLRESWLGNGGRTRDVELLTGEHLEWMARRPALGRYGSTLLAHCDSTIYLELGDGLDAVNAHVAATLAGDDLGRWAELESRLWRRNELHDPARARRFLDRFECDRLVHGHTPIPVVTGREPSEVTEPLVYADGACVNVDGGIYMGGPGFLLPLL